MIQDDVFVRIEVAKWLHCIYSMYNLGNHYNENNERRTLSSQQMYFYGQEIIVIIF